MLFCIETSQLLKYVLMIAHDNNYKTLYSDTVPYRQSTFSIVNSKQKASVAKASA